MGSLTNL